MARTFALGDIHGGYKSLVQCLERSGFDKEVDTLIQVGDVADGWSQVPECVEELLTIKNLIPIRGNHDDWFIQWYRFRTVNPMWLKQGGRATYEAYTIYHIEKLDDHYDRFWDKQHHYYHDKENNRVFVHGGYASHEGIGNDSPSTYMWDRDLWRIALSGHPSVKKGYNIPRILRPHNEIFLGHSSTGIWDTDQPMEACNVWNIDTGGGFEGRLTIMDVDTKEYWQSDPVRELYAKERGRS